MRNADDIKRILLEMATKNYDKERRTIICSFDSKQLNNVANLLSPKRICPHIIEMDGKHYWNHIVRADYFIKDGKCHHCRKTR